VNGTGFTRKTAFQPLSYTHLGTLLTNLRCRFPLNVQGDIEEEGEEGEKKKDKEK
jgi:hypothetical protein